MKGENLGDPIDYGAYLMGQLTGSTGSRRPRHVRGERRCPPLPDFNLDSDRGYAYQCWDYMRHVQSKPRPPHPQANPDDSRAWPDQWRCAPKIVSLPRRSPARQATLDATGPRHVRLRRAVHRPPALRREATTPPPLALRPAEAARPPLPAEGRRVRHPAGWDKSDLQVSKAEMRDAAMSPTGRKPVP